MAFPLPGGPKGTKSGAGAVDFKVRPEIILIVFALSALAPPRRTSKQNKKVLHLIGTK